MSAENFNPQRAEALRSAIQGTAYRITNYPASDAKTLLTEHLALLQEAELIYLTDAFVGEGEERIGTESDSVPPDIPETDPHAELRKSWAPGQRWQARSFRNGEWGPWTPAVASGPLWLPHQEYRRHPADIDPPKPWCPDNSGEWVEVPDDCMRCPVPPETEIEYLLRFERNRKSWEPDVREACNLSWTFATGRDARIVAYKVVK